MTTVAINGFGRIGRAFFRQAFGQDNLRIVRINDPGMNLEQAFYLLERDSVYGIFDAGPLRSISFTSVTSPLDKPWGNINVVIEASGKFRTFEKASQHLEAGADKVIITAPPQGDFKECIPQIVWGVNQQKYHPDLHDIISGASCTTNCLAPVLYVLMSNFGIVRGSMTTIHAYTGNQAILDGPHNKLTRGRAAATNIIPTTTGAASAIGSVLSQLKGKIDGLAMRVPVPTGSVLDLTVELEKESTPAQINEAFEEASMSPELGEVLVIETDMVSTDCIGSKYSAIVDKSSTLVTDGKLAKVVAFYDNEWGYATKIFQLAKYIV